MIDPSTFAWLAPALTGLKDLTTITKTITDTDLRVELNSKLIDVQTALLEARQEMLKMQREYEMVLIELRELKAATAEEEPHKIVYGCYKFEGKEGLYCPACYDTKRKKHLAARIDSHFYKCTVCGANLA